MDAAGNFKWFFFLLGENIACKRPLSNLDFIEQWIVSMNKMISNFNITSTVFQKNLVRNITECWLTCTFFLDLYHICKNTIFLSVCAQNLCNLWCDWSCFRIVLISVKFFGRKRFLLEVFISCKKNILSFWVLFYSKILEKEC